MDYLALKDELPTRPGSKVMMVLRGQFWRIIGFKKMGKVPEIRPKIAKDPIWVSFFREHPRMICVFWRLSQILGKIQCRIAEKTYQLLLQPNAAFWPGGSTHAAGFIVRFDCTARNRARAIVLSALWGFFWALVGLCALKSDLLAVKTEREALLPLKNGTAKSVKFQQIPRFFIKFLVELVPFASMQAYYVFSEGPRKFWAKFNAALLRKPTNYFYSQMQHSGRVEVPTPRGLS